MPVGSYPKSERVGWRGDFSRCGKKYSVCIKAVIRERHDSRALLPDMRGTAPGTGSVAALFGVDLSVAFVIIYACCPATIRIYFVRRRTHGYEDEFYSQSSGHETCRCPESAQRREHQRREHHGNPQGRGVSVRTQPVFDRRGLPPRPADDKKAQVRTRLFAASNGTPAATAHPAICYT